MIYIRISCHHSIFYRDKAENLKKRAQRDADEFQKEIRDRQDFTTELSSSIEALQSTDLELKPQESLPLATEGVEVQLDKYYDQRHHLMAKVNWLAV